MASRFISHTACLESSLSSGNETVDDMTAILGYARVSTAGQDLDVQLAALTAVDVDTERVFTDKLSGSAKTARPGLAAMLDYPVPATVLSSPPSIGSVARSLKSLAP